MMPGVEFMLLGHKRVTERDLKNMKSLIYKMVLLLFAIAASLFAYAHV